MTDDASNRLLVPVVAENECRAKKNTDPAIIDTEVTGGVAGAATPSEPAVPDKGDNTKPYVADEGDETPLGWTQVMADSTLGEGLWDLEVNRIPEELQFSHGVGTEQAVRILEGIDRVNRPFDLSLSPTIYRALSGSPRILVIETTHLTGEVTLNLFPLSPENWFSKVEDIQLDPASSSDSMVFVCS